MDVLIKSGEIEIETEFSKKHLKRFETQKADPFLQGKAFIDALLEDGRPLGPYINVFLKQERMVQYKGKIFVLTRHMSNVIPRFRNPKNCPECGTIIMCDCHDTCHHHSGCEKADKRYGAVEIFGNRIITSAMSYFFQYDDKRENAERDARDRGEWNDPEDED